MPDPHEPRASLLPLLLLPLRASSASTSSLSPLSDASRLPLRRTLALSRARARGEKERPPPLLLILLPALVAGSVTLSRRYFLVGYLSSVAAAR